MFISKKEHFRIVTKYVDDINDILEKHQEEISNYKKLLREQKGFDKIDFSVYVLVSVGINKNQNRVYILSDNVINSPTFYIYCPYRMRNVARIHCKYLEYDKEMRIIDIISHNMNQGHGTILLNYLEKYCVNNGISTITGWLSPQDEENFDKLKYFYEKSSFVVDMSSHSIIRNLSKLI